MADFNITKAPFITTSRENWLMLKRMDKENVFEVIQAIADYVLDGVEPSYDGLTGMVTEQIVSVINRKGQKSFNSKNNLDKANAAKQAKVVSQTPTEDISNYTRKITEEDLEKIYEAEFKGSSKDFEWRVRETASKTGLTQDNVQNIYADFRNNKRQ